MTDAIASITMCLRRMRDGDAAAGEAVMPLLYDELRAIAGRLLRADRAHTLQPTALLHEAWLKIVNASDRSAPLQDRVHFLAVAARAMRQVLCNHARDRRAHKRGGDAARVPLDDCLDLLEQETGDVVALHDLLDGLARENPRLASVVEMRVFGGMTIPEAAAALGIAETTVKDDWRFARALLQQRLRPD